MSTPFLTISKNANLFHSFALIENDSVSTHSNLHPLQVRHSNQLSSFLSHTPHVTWIVDNNFDLINASQPFFDLVNTQEIKGSKKIFDLLPNSLSNGLFQKHVKVKETGEPITFLQSLKRANGDEEQYLISIFRYAAADQMLQGQAIKMTEDLQTYSPTQKADENLLQTDHHASTANWEWNMRTNEIYRNPIMQELIGFSNTASKSLSWWFSRIHPDDCKVVRDTIKDIIAQKGHNWECTYRFKNNAGKYLFVHDRGFVIYEDGQAIRMICAFQDLTELKVDEALRTDEKVKAQKEITETILHIQEKERDRVSSNLNENINQILAAAKMFIESIEPSNVSFESNKEKAVEYVLMGIKEIRKLYKEMLTKEPVTGSSLTDNINMLVDDMQSGRDIKVSFQTSENMESISTGRKSTLFRIVQEQLKNIVQHSHAKNVKVSILLFSTSLQLIIWDDGNGFDPSQIKWGIGLSSIHQRTKLYNGIIDIKSAAGKGCKMSIKLPLFS